MTLSVVVKGPEGIVLAADTRINLHSQGPKVPFPLLVNYDDVTKLLNFGPPHDWVGAVTYGAPLIGTRTAHSFVPELESQLGSRRLSVREYAARISSFFQEQWHETYEANSEQTPSGMYFIVGGFDPDDPHGKVCEFSIPLQDGAELKDHMGFCVRWGGETDIINRLIHGYDPKMLQLVQKRFGVSRKELEEFRLSLKHELEHNIPYEVLPLQGCVDLAVLLIRTTMTTQKLAIGARGVGGAIEIATITRTEGWSWIQKKALQGET